MRTLALVLLAAVASAEESKTYDLSFAPKEGDRLVIALSQDVTWDYKDRGSSGQMKTGLTLRWTFGRNGAGRGVFDRVEQKGEGDIKGNKWTTGIEWTAKDGFVKGADDADFGNLKEEIAKGLKLNFDARGASSAGEC